MASETAASALNQALEDLRLQQGWKRKPGHKQRDFITKPWDDLRTTVFGSADGDATGATPGGGGPAVECKPQPHRRGFVFRLEELQEAESKLSVLPHKFRESASSEFVHTDYAKARREVYREMHTARAAVARRTAVLGDGYAKLGLSGTQRGSVRPRSSIGVRRSVSATLNTSRSRASVVSHRKDSAGVTASAATASSPILPAPNIEPVISIKLHDDSALHMMLAWLERHTDVSLRLCNNYIRKWSQSLAEVNATSYLVHKVAECARVPPSNPATRRTIAVLGFWFAARAPRIEKIVQLCVTHGCGPTKRSRSVAARPSSAPALRASSGPMVEVGMGWTPPIEDPRPKWLQIFQQTSTPASVKMFEAELSLPNRAALTELAMQEEALLQLCMLKGKVS